MRRLYLGWADTHPWFREQHEWIAGLFPGCQVHLLAGAGHAVVGTHAPSVAQLVATFLAAGIEDGRVGTYSWRRKFSTARTRRCSWTSGARSSLVKIERT